MRRATAAIFLWAVFFTFPSYGDLTTENFVLKSTKDLVALCSVTREDPNVTAAIHFCHGYMLGLTHFNIVMGRVFEGRIYCMDERNRPTRDQAIAMFVKWHKANPKYGNESALDGVLRWAGADFPCAKKTAG